jgi:hypothetical protein
LRDVPPFLILYCITLLLYCKALLLYIAEVWYSTLMIDSYVVAHGIKWKLETWLESKGKTRYELARAMGGNEKANQTTLYRLGTAERIDHKTLSRVILAAEKLTGQRPKISDLLEYEGE